MSLVIASCADDGYNDDESWNSSVKNSQLSNPSEITYTKTSTSDTEKTIVFSWNVVHGAGGYLVSLYDVSNPAKTLPVVTDSLIDRCSVAFVLPNEYNYELSLRTLGNKKLGNKDAAEASIQKFDTYLPSMAIPAGSEISSWLANNLVDSDAEQGFVLEAGANYTLTSYADFRLNVVEFRGNKNNAPTITVSDSGCFVTQAGLKIRDLNIDCTDATRVGLITLSDNPDANISTEALGYKALGANQDGFVIQKPVVYQNCLIKNLPNSLLYGNKTNWSLCDFRVVDCIVQMANNDTKPVINLVGASNGLIQKLTISNSTFYNTVRNENECYFLRFSNQSNAQPKKIFGNANNYLEWSITNSSFLRTNPKKDFANNLGNTQNAGQIWIKVTDCVFFDVYRLYQILQSQWVKTTENNFMSYSDFCTPTTTDYGPAGRTDQNGNFYTTLDETPEFDEADLKVLDFSKENGGVSLAPKGLAQQNKSGDPRWY